MAGVIRESVNQGVRDFRDFAIFIRTSGLSRPFEQALRSRNIPYQVIGGYSFFEAVRSEICLLMSGCSSIRVIRPPLHVS